jgi:hypothetical protein
MSRCENHFGVRQLLLAGILIVFFKTVGWVQPIPAWDRVAQADPIKPELAKPINWRADQFRAMFEIR